jgi:hypothetical protein
MFVVRAIALVIGSSGLALSGLFIITPAADTTFYSTVGSIGCSGGDTDNTNQAVQYTVEVFQNLGKMEAIAGSASGWTDQKGSWADTIDVNGGLKAGLTTGVRVRDGFGDVQDTNSINIVDP